MQHDGRRQVEHYQKDKDFDIREENWWGGVQRCVPEVHGLLPLQRRVNWRQEGEKAGVNWEDILKYPQGFVLIVKFHQNNIFCLLGGISCWYLYVYSVLD
jgi:hypothetical protein